MRRFCPAVETMRAVLERIESYPWAGEEEVEARIEWYVQKGGNPCHYPLKPVRFHREDVAALLAELGEEVSAIICAKPVNAEGRKAAAAAAAARFRREKEKEAARPKPQPTDPATVRPSLRHLLSDEAKAEGRKLWDRLDLIPGGTKALASNADHLSETFPLIAQADDALDGKIREMLRAAAALPAEVKLSPNKGPWVNVAWLIREGRPQHLTARYVDGKKVEGAVDKALRHIADLRQRMEAKIAADAEAKAAQGDGRPASRLPWHLHPASPEDAAAQAAERAERDRLGLGAGSLRDATPEELALIREARRRAIASLPGHTEKVAAAVAEREERERLGLLSDDVPTDEERALIERARSRAAALASPIPADCPF
ncbi:hypothetical protein [Microvirga calopogonii]|uniref:hypothetical protein n=1 Tax=Microvirga calopogonii TaxID=2078013 RepID=UPI0013B3D33C|nr:hypothetical protein [Microvirga calopogonii]